MSVLLSWGVERMKGASVQVNESKGWRIKRRGSACNDGGSRLCGWSEPEEAAVERFVHGNLTPSIRASGEKAPREVWMAAVSAPPRVSDATRVAPTPHYISCPPRCTFPASTGETLYTFVALSNMVNCVLPYV